MPALKVRSQAEMDVSRGVKPCSSLCIEADFLRRPEVRQNSVVMLSVAPGCELSALHIGFLEGLCQSESMIRALISNSLYGNFVADSPKHVA